MDDSGLRVEVPDADPSAKGDTVKWLGRIPVKYFIIIPICSLVAVCNFFVAKTLADSIAVSKQEIFIEKNITNLRAVLPTLALSIWEFNVDRVASTLTGIDDGESFLYASVWADDLEFSFRGNRALYSISDSSLIQNTGVSIEQGHYLMQGDVLAFHFPIRLQQNDYKVGYITAGFDLTSLVGEHRDIINQVNSIAAFATSIVLLGIIVYSWYANFWLSSIARSITNLAKGQLQSHVELSSRAAEFQDIDHAVRQLKNDAYQLIELKSKARSDEKIRHMAMHDALTNLANRRYLETFKK